jgi:hypothetical protein
MSNNLIKLVAVVAAITAASVGIARADCEADLLLLEAALAAPNLAAEAKATLDAAGVAGASALRKDDDEACNTAVKEALAKTGATPAPAASAASNGASLGDLAPFKAIAADTLKIVKSGDLAAAKARIKDLETAWDNSAKAMKAANRDKWTTVDDAIDVALKKLRAAKPAAADSSAALTALIEAIDKTT